MLLSTSNVDIKTSKNALNTQRVCLFQFSFISAFRLLFKVESKCGYSKENPNVDILSRIQVFVINFRINLALKQFKMSSGKSSIS